MVKRILTGVIAFAVAFCLMVKVDAAESEASDDSWLIYLYICGSNLESGGHYATKDIAEMQQVKYPHNVNVLIAAGGTKKWHHPTLDAGGNGIYLYNSNRLEKQVDWNENMGDPATLASFLKFGEDNFPAARKIILFWNHGGLGGVCYDDNFQKDCLNYDELKRAFAAVYGNSPENPPFELIIFEACLTGSYELANSVADFSHYMLGAEPSIYDSPFKDWLAALAQDTSMNGAQIGKVFCDSAMKNYSKDMKLTHLFSVIDLTKMPELREAYEGYFDEALRRSDEEGFLGAFARAAEKRNVDRYSNLYTDLGLLAKNTKSIMPESSDKLLKAIDKAVVYKKSGAYLKSKGISTYYPYISLEGTPEQEIKKTHFCLEQILSGNFNYNAQKEVYKGTLNLKDLPETGEIVLEKNSAGHFVAKPEFEQIKDISSVRSILLPVKENDNSRLGGVDIGGAILTSADNFKADWKKGTFTENFTAFEPVFDGHKIALLPSVSGRGHSFYKVPVIHNELKRDLIVRYDTSTKKYSIIGFGSEVENGMVRDVNDEKKKLQFGDVITPIHMVITDDPTEEPMGILGYKNAQDEEGNIVSIPVYASSVHSKSKDPTTGMTLYLKYAKGVPFVYTRDSEITNRQIASGNFLYFFAFNSPGGYATTSEPGFINVEYGKVTRFTAEELAEIAYEE